MAENVQYNRPPHMDPLVLIRRAVMQLRAWHEKYGEHQPSWLPPAGDVRWLEDAHAYLAAHTLPRPTTIEFTQQDGSEPVKGGALARPVKLVEGPPREIGQGLDRYGEHIDKPEVHRG